jgi:hypothetical protein
LSVLVFCTKKNLATLGCSRSITLTLIFRQYHYEQPWPSAQAEIRRLAAYKTPQVSILGIFVSAEKLFDKVLSFNSS